VSEQDKDIRDLDLSDEEGEDVKGGVKGPMPPSHMPPGKPAVKSPGTATGSAPPTSVIPKSPKGPGRLPPGS